jgi:hypothetical protein
MIELAHQLEDSVTLAFREQVEVDSKKDHKGVVCHMGTKRLWSLSLQYPVESSTTESILEALLPPASHRSSHHREGPPVTVIRRQAVKKQASGTLFEGSFALGGQSQGWWDVRPRIIVEVFNP